MSVAPATLYVVATPIGNLDDLGARAREILADVAVVAAEDTRHTKRLLAAWNIGAKLLALHEHNEAARAPELVRRLRAGESVALVSDAGTPLVSDPGYRLVRAAQEAGVAVRAVPGPCAAVAALSVAGLSTDRFVFEGFLPARAAARRKRLEELAADTRTLVFYEAPHRLAATLADCVQVFGAEHEAALARELTKLHESVRRGPLDELARLVESGEEPALGECVLLVSGAGERAAEDDADALLEALLAEGVSAKTAAAVARRLSARPRRELYQRATELKKTLSNQKDE